MRWIAYRRAAESVPQRHGGFDGVTFCCILPKYPHSADGIETFLIWRVKNCLPMRRAAASAMCLGLVWVRRVMPNQLIAEVVRQ